MTLTNSTIQTRLGLCAAALAGTAAAVPSAQAAIITFNTSIVVPATAAGIYINLATGATGSSAGTTTGWDFNPYLVGATSALGFYWSPSTVGGLRGAGVATTSTSNQYAVLTPGTTVNSSSFFTSAIQGTTPNYTTGATGDKILGFRFVNEATGVLNFGYMVINTTAGNGFPATIRGWSYQNDGTAITVVPEPSTTALLSVAAIALGALGVRKWRRQANAA
jgi:hypothetical protein